MAKRQEGEASRLLLSSPSSADTAMLRACASRLGALRSRPPLIPASGAPALGAPRVLCAALVAARDMASGRSQRGIYAGKDVRSGNNVSFSHRKTRRTFKPNVQRKRLWSVTLGCWLRFNMTTHALRCIDKAGGIDDYLLKTPDAKLNSISGVNAKRLIESARAAPPA